MKTQTFENWLKVWFKTYKKPFLKNPKKMQSQIRMYIPPEIKKLTLDKLTALLIQKSLNTIKRSRTAQDIYDIYNGSLRVACALGYIKRNPCEMVLKPKHKYKNGVPLTEEELNDFLEKIKGHRAENCFKFILYSGCRRSEALSLTWEDIDFQRQEIHIKGTKTDGSDRFIPLFENLAKLFEQMPKGEGKIFHHRPDYLTKSFKKLMPKHQLKNLRHTFISRCADSSIPLKVVQGWAGHSDIATTGNIYTKVSKKTQIFYSKTLKF